MFLPAMSSRGISDLKSHRMPSTTRGRFGKQSCNPGGNSPVHPWVTCLNKLPYRMISGDELVCCLDGCFSALFAAGQLISYHAEGNTEIPYRDDPLPISCLYDQKALYLNFTAFSAFHHKNIHKPARSRSEPTGQ